MDDLVRLPEAAQMLGMTVGGLRTTLWRGRIPEAVRVPNPHGGRGCWAIPRATLEGIEVTADGFHRWTVKARGEAKLTRAGFRWGRSELRGVPRCDCCKILLEHSGDRTHPNDAPDAGRCWMCREEFGTGPVSEIAVARED